MLRMKYATLWHEYCFSQASVKKISVQPEITLDMENTMKTKTAISKTATSTSSQAKTDTQVYSAGFVAVGLSACAIGLWAFACLIGGMVTSGGPLGLVSGWFKAVFGL
jgi:hypothetical protein